jgi:uncharacterized protein GlcG (DUF336 family)
MRIFISGLALAGLPALWLAAPAMADGSSGSACDIPAATVAQVQSQLSKVVHLSDDNGGIFTPNRMWSAVVDRFGVLCSVISTAPVTSQQDPWPGSRAIAIAKASTANDFSNTALALSTANLYASTQPGGSLWGLNQSNPFNPQFQPEGTGIGEVPGGIITFGGGVALYNSSGQVIGGLGVSGDSSCADHAIAYRMRLFAGLNNTPSDDNIQYAAAGTTPTGFEQPHCFPSDLTPAQIASPPSQ